MKKEELNELMNASIKSYEQREEAKRKLKHLQIGAEQDFRQVCYNLPVIPSRDDRTAGIVFLSGLWH